MNVFVEFTVGPTDFAFADALEAAPDVSVTFERLVPVTADELPYVWVTGAGVDAFEAAVRRSERADLSRLAEISDSRFYRVSWAENPPLLDATTAVGGVILEVSADDRWFFRVRYPDHDAVSSFYDRIPDVSLEVDRVWTLTDEFERDMRYGLTPEQREAITLALDRGYFATPRNATLSDLADELDISQQALSDRVRRANEKILRRALRPEPVDGREAGLSHSNERRRDSA